jgi:hypothetical protein
MGCSLFDAGMDGLLSGLILFEFDCEATNLKYDSSSYLVILTPLSRIVATSQMTFHRSLEINVLLIFLYHSL